ncbi:unnamed protein product [Parnassius apollo]|uniref:UBX domain-containing protein 4 n=1 Tax=Parnassius apollo TaxID=110799 RepID=A0A8S3WBV7_PARAO|nr:unnamed protein product [Parnassius apollo]
MHWYGGSIAEAVTLSKQRNAIFVVFVEGDNEQSAEMSATIDDSAVVKRLSDPQNFLAIKLKSGSINYTHFAQIYQFVPVPSLFFISRNGTPLEVVCAGVEAQNLATRIDRILEEHNKEKQRTVQPSTSSQSLKEQTVNLLQAEAAVSNKEAAATPSVDKKPPADVETETSSEPVAKVAKTDYHEVTRTGQEYEVVCDGDICVRKPKAKPEEPGPSSKVTPTAESKDTPASSQASAVSPDEKVERAKELIDALRREKTEKEKELEKQKELERRAIGQGVAELKRWQADQELKQIQEERKREKMENNLARQRILEQIAQDRAERRARDQPPAAPAPPASQPAPPPPPPTVGDGGSRARVQFKMADGSAHTAHFDVDATLQELRRYVADNLQLRLGEFSLWTAFPRQELTESESTLRQLRLAPSAALLVLPRRTPTVVASPSTFSTIFTFLTQLFTSLILEPSQQVYAWLRARLFPGSPPSPSPASPSPSPSPPPAPQQPGFRRRGNIHRLAGDTNSDDENNTWNGNSTQQM